MIQVYSKQNCAFTSPSMQHHLKMRKISFENITKDEKVEISQIKVVLPPKGSSSVRQTATSQQTR